MQADLFFVIGLVVAVLAIPSIIGAFSDSRPPRAGAIMVMIGGGLIALAIWQKPSGYALGDIPDAFTRVIGHYLR